MWKVANKVAIEEDLEPEPITLDANVLNTGIIDLLENAEGKNKIVVVIVDTWTLHLKQYRNFIQRYDNHDCFNCVVLVPWNPDCNETKQCREALEGAIQQIFPKKWIRWIRKNKEGGFRASIHSLEELKQHLSEALNEARELIYDHNEVRSAKSDNEPPEPIPGIRGPGGAIG